MSDLRRCRNYRREVAIFVRASKPKTRAEKIMLILIESGFLYFLFFVRSYPLLPLAFISSHPMLVICGYRRGGQHTHPRIQHAPARICQHRLDVHDKPHPRHLPPDYRHSGLPAEVLYRHKHKRVVRSDRLDAVHLEPIVYFRRNSVLGWQHFNPLRLTPDPEARDAPQQT